MKQKQNKVNLIGKPRELTQDMTVSCVIPGCKVIDSENIIAYIALGVQTYNDSGEEVTEVFIVNKGEKPIYIADESYKSWYINNEVFQTDVLEQIWQDWREYNSPEDEEESYEESDDNLNISYKGHITYKEQEKIISELFKVFMEV